MGFSNQILQMSKLGLKAIKQTTGEAEREVLGGPVVPLDETRPPLTPPPTPVSPLTD